MSRAENPSPLNRFSTNQYRSVNCQDDSGFQLGTNHLATFGFTSAALREWLNLFATVKEALPYDLFVL